MHLEKLCVWLIMLSSEIMNKKYIAHDGSTAPCIHYSKAVISAKKYLWNRVRVDLNMEQFVSPFCRVGMCGRY